MINEEILKKKPEKDLFKVLSPTAILGYGFPEKSFYNGIALKPDLIAVDAGSTDPGPYYLGSGVSFTDRIGVKRDLRYMIKAGIENNIPVVISSAGGSGAKPHMDWCEEIIMEIAKEEKLSFTLGLIYADIDKKIIKKAIEQNKIEPLDYIHPLTVEIVDNSTYIVAQMGIEPIVEALKNGCDIVLAGRAYDPAPFSALPIMLGYDKALATHMGKILECAAIAADPGSGADCVLGVLDKDNFVLCPLSDERKFTEQSVAAHSLYEKSDPMFLPGPGGTLDLREVSFTEIGEGKVQVKGTKFIEANPYKIKLEGARKVGYRTITIAGTHDPIMIKNIDEILLKAKQKAMSILEKENIKGDIYFHVYGKNGVMGDLEPINKALSYEVGILIEVVSETQQMANTICSIMRSTLLHYGYEERISTAGNLAFPFSPSDIKAQEVYEFSIYHLMEIDDFSHFPLKIKNIDFK